MYFIYALYDNKGNTYIGKTNNPRRRYFEHLNDKRSCETQKRAWLDSLLENNIFPHIRIIEVVDSNWRARERYWIAEMERQGMHLLNETKGGDGPDGKTCKPLPTSFYALIP
jgi:hypothetical protein